MRFAAFVLTSFALVVPSWTIAPLVAQTGFRQTQTDSYTRYELLDPRVQSFRIIYDVSATTAGATYYFNGIRRGSEPTVHGVYDLMTGVSLPWAIVDGSVARQRGMLNASPEGQYIQVELARPVPEGGQARLRIDKTYRDTLSYTYDDDNGILFDRSLGIKRNSIVLPAGYELTGVNYPVQVVREADGRIKLSFMNRGPAGVPLQVRGRRLSLGNTTSLARLDDRPPVERQTVTNNVLVGARVNYEFTERAFQDRDIVYFLQQPETNSFRLYHDYTESRVGVDRYLNVVRAGSRASNPSAKILDTGRVLEVETLRGNAITERGIGLDDVTPETEVVVIWFDPVRAGQSVRLRIEETYTDRNRYKLVGDELIWDRNFGRPRNTVILPDGWFVTANSIPAVIDMTDDGRVRLRYENDRPGGIDVFVKAERRR